MKASPFQIVVIAIFCIALVGGVVVLSLSKSKSSGVNSVPVVVWGTLSNDLFNAAVAGITEGSSGYKIVYEQKLPESFDHDLIEALASGIGPDVILLPQDLIARYRDKIALLSYDTLPIRNFKDTFIQEAELYLDDNGIIALPFSVNPLVMYWNRDMLTNIGEALPPQTWDQFITLSPKLSVKDKNLNILKSAVSLGGYRNITNALEIISTLLMQAGNPITLYSGGSVTTALTASVGTIGAINFYTDFANPLKPNYSWNPSLPSSRDMFASGDMAFYFGFASEMTQIRNKNSNLNFDVTYFPQPKGASVLTTFGKMQGLAVMRSSANSASAFQVILAMTQPQTLGALSGATGLPPVRRSMLVADPKDPYQTVFYNSALRSRAWVDSNPANSNSVLQNMIDTVISGEADVGKAVGTAGKNIANPNR